MFLVVGAFMTVVTGEEIKRRLSSWLPNQSEELDKTEILWWILVTLCRQQSKKFQL